MNKTTLTCLLGAALAATAFPAGAQAPATELLPQTAHPPKGWNSWDSYGMYPTQEAMLANLDVMARRLKPAGYEYFVIDAGWNKVKDAEGKIVTMSLNGNSLYVPNPATFPGGLKAVADRAHALGLKFGVHIMRGISRIAWRDNQPVGTTSYHARDIADTSSTCRWNADNYGVDMSKPGAQEYYDAYIAQLAGWGVDFIKADDICGFPREIDAVVQAIRKTGRNITLSLSPGGDSKPEYFSTYKNADMLRVTKDVWDDQIGIDRVFTAWKLWNGVDHNGFWLDMDMIPFGHLCLQHPDPNFRTALPGKFKGEKQSEHLSFFTDDQKMAFMAMRALAASPLFMGGDLPTSDDRVFTLLTNKDMIACDENGVVGTQVSDKDSVEVWKVADKNKAGRGWVGVFNRRKDPQTFALSAAALGLPGKDVKLENIWKNKEQTKLKGAAATTVTINPGAVLFYTYVTN